MIPIHQKEIIVRKAIEYLTMLSEDFKRCEKKSYLENSLPLIANHLLQIVEADKQDHNLIDILEGYKSYGDKKKLDHSINPYG